MENTPAPTYQMKVTLNGTKVPIWRRFTVSAGSSFAQLHDIIQTVMGWEHCHLFEFSAGRTVVGVPMDEELDLFGERAMLDADDTRLNELFASKKRCTYLYDFGDGWQHTLEREKVLDAAPPGGCPACLEGARACPPEDCGGPWGYEELADILENPAHPEHAERLEWLGLGEGEFDPEAFDLAAVNAALADLPCYRPAGATPGEDAPEDEDAPGEDGADDEDDDAEVFTPPSLEQWRALYALAAEIKETESWRELADGDYIAVQPPGYKEPVFFSTMGMLGECVAVAALPNLGALATLENMRRRIAAGVPLAGVGEQDCVVCYFGDREEVTRDDREVMASLGLKFRGRGAWIHFRSLWPGYAPWRISAGEAKLLRDTLGQYLQAVRDLRAGKCAANFDRGVILLRQCAPPPSAAGWGYAGVRMDKLEYNGPAMTIDDELYVARMKKLKKTRTDLEMDMPWLPMPIEEKRGARPYLPRLLLLADAKSGALLGQNILSEQEEEPVEVFKILDGHTHAAGLPRSLTVRSEALKALAGDWCAKLGVALHVDMQLPVMDEAIAMLVQMMGFGDDFDDEWED